MKRIAARALALGTLAVTFSTAGRADSLLNDWNVVVTGDAYVGSTDAQGPVRIGGDLRTTGQYTVSAHGATGGTGGVGLMVGGDVIGAQSGGIKLENSKALIGGTSTPTSVFANGTATVGTAAKVNGVSIPDVVSGDAALLQGYSQGFAALTANNTFQVTGGGNTGLFKVTTTDANGNAVFDVTAAQVFGASGIGQLDLDLNGHAFGAGQSVVINVSGNVSYAGGINFNGDFAANSHAALANVIWNFTDATSINLNGGNFSGAMLAYNATLTNMNTIEGSVFVKQIGTTLDPLNGQTHEIHLPLYNGYVPNAVPEPTGLAMAGIAALAGAAFGMRRRSA